MQIREIREVAQGHTAKSGKLGKKAWFSHSLWWVWADPGFLSNSNCSPICASLSCKVPKMPMHDTPWSDHWVSEDHGGGRWRWVEMSLQGWTTQPERGSDAWPRDRGRRGVEEAKITHLHDFFIPHFSHVCSLLVTFCLLRISDYSLRNLLVADSKLITCLPLYHGGWALLESEVLPAPRAPGKWLKQTV